MYTYLVVHELKSEGGFTDTAATYHYDFVQSRLLGVIFLHGSWQYNKFDTENVLLVFIVVVLFGRRDGGAQYERNV